MKANSNYLPSQSAGNPDVAFQASGNCHHVDPKTRKRTIYAFSDHDRKRREKRGNPNSNYLGLGEVGQKAARTSKVLLSALAKVARTLLLTIPGRWLLYEHPQDHPQTRCVIPGQTATPRWNPVLQDVQDETGSHRLRDR